MTLKKPLEPGMRLIHRASGEPRLVDRDGAVRDPADGALACSLEAPHDELNDLYQIVQSEPYKFATDAAGRLEIAGQMEKGELPGIMLPIPPARKVAPGDWLQSLTSAERKEIAVARGCFAYFPDALALVARHSVRSNEKHNPGQPVHWSREKSSDHEDCIGRHSLAVAADQDSLDGDVPHMICRAWRSLAALQLWAEGKAKRGGKV